MKELSKFTQPSNPLGLMALFTLLVEAIAGSSLIAAIVNNSSYQVYLILFVIIFPTILLFFFMAVVILKREALYAPSDFKDDKTFVDLFKLVKKTEVRVKALSVDLRGQAEDLNPIIKELIDNNDIDGLVTLAKGFLKIRRYDFCINMLENLSGKPKINIEQHDQLNKLLGIALIMEGNLDRGSAILKGLRETESLSARVALAYSSFKMGDVDKYHEQIESIRNHPDFHQRISGIAIYYQEIKRELLD